MGCQKDEGVNISSTFCSIIVAGSGTLSGCCRFCARIPGVSLRSTPGYYLGSLRDEKVKVDPPSRKPFGVTSGLLGAFVDLMRVVGGEAGVIRGLGVIRSMVTRRRCGRRGNMVFVIAMFRIVLGHFFLQK